MTVCLDRRSYTSTLVVLAALLQVSTLPPVSPVLFDDFTYSTVRPGAENSILGSNDWHLSRDVAGPLKQSRAWYWYNWYEPHGDAETISTYLSLAAPSVLRITVPAGFEQGDPEPAIVSGFTTQIGTHAARVRFALLPRRPRMQQAFWLISPLRWIDGEQHYATEMDFEWNNWFTSDLSTRTFLHATNHGYRSGSQRQASKRMMCFPSGNKTTERVDCASHLSVGSTSSPFVILLITYHGDRVTYRVVDDRPEGTLLASVDIDQALPAWPSTTLSAVFSQHVRSGEPISQSRDLDIDWYYFTPRIDITAQEILSDVKGLRRQGLAHVNTTSLSQQVDTAYSAPWRIVVSGPDTLNATHRGYWRAVTPQRWGRLTFTWSIRQLGTRSWTPVSRRAPWLRRTLSQGVWEIEATVQVASQTHRDTITVHVE